MLFHGVRVASASSSSPSSPEHTNGGHTTSPIPQCAPSTIHMVNIRSYVPITLDLSESNYNQWRVFFNTVFGKLALSAHINTSSRAPVDAEWVMIYFAIVNWLYTMVSMEVLDLVMKPGNAYDVWHTIEGLFRDNRLTCAIYIEAEFCSFYGRPHTRSPEIMCQP